MFVNNLHLPIFLVWFTLWIVVLLFSHKWDWKGSISLSIGYGLTLATHIYALVIWYLFDSSKQGFQFTSYIPLLSEYNVYFSLGLDGISLSFLLLTTLVMYLCMESCKKTKIKSARAFIFCILSIELFLMISFITTDILCFYIFFESVLIPMFVMIGYWGSRERRNKAGFYLFLYTLLGSLFLLFGIMFLYTWTSSTSYETLMRLKLPADIQIKYWICFFLPFAIKIPMVPFHIWLPEAHVEAPTIGSVILASLLLKLGGYGFIRFTLPMFPIANEYFGPLIYTLGIISVVYASMSTLRQIDLKRIIAYSSIAHMNVVVLGLFSYTQQGIDGAIYMMLAHGFVSSGLFFCVGILYDRYKTRLLEYYGGLATVNPIFSFFFCFFSFANMGFPGTSNFIGEFLILVGLFEKNTFVMVFAATGVVLSAIYSIWLFNRVCFGTLKTEYIKKFININESEIYILSMLTLFTLYFGLNSSPITDLVSLPVAELLQIAVENKKK